MKTNIHGHGDGHETFEGWHVFHMPTNIRHEQVRVLFGLCIIAVHAGTHGDEVKVVAVIHHGVDALRTTRLDVGAVHGRGLFVGLHCGFIVAGADVNMRGHVYDVSGV